MGTPLLHGYTPRRWVGPHVVNGRNVRHFRDAVDKTITITDDDLTRDELVQQTAEATERSVLMDLAERAKAQAKESTIELLYGLMPRCPLIPDTETPRLPFGPPLPAATAGARPSADWTPGRALRRLIFP